MEKWTALLLLACIVGGISICCPGWGKAPASLLRAPAPAPDAQAALNSSGANAAMAGSAVREADLLPFTGAAPAAPAEYRPLPESGGPQAEFPAAEDGRAEQVMVAGRPFTRIWAAHGATAAAHDRMDGSVHGDLTGIFVASCEASKKQTR